MSKRKRRRRAETEWAVFTKIPPYPDVEVEERGLSKREAEDEADKLQRRNPEWDVWADTMTGPPSLSPDEDRHRGEGEMAPRSGRSRTAAEYGSVDDAVKSVGRPDSKNQWLVEWPDGGASVVYGGSPEAAVSTALHNEGYTESLERDGVAVADSSLVGEWQALGYDGRWRTVRVWEKGRSARRSRRSSRRWVQVGDKHFRDGSSWKLYHPSGGDYPEGGPFPAFKIWYDADGNPESYQPGIAEPPHFEPDSSVEIENPPSELRGLKKKSRSLSAASRSFESSEYDLETYADILPTRIQRAVDSVPGVGASLVDTNFDDRNEEIYGYLHIDNVSGDFSLFYSFRGDRDTLWMSTSEERGGEDLAEADRELERMGTSHISNYAEELIRETQEKLRSSRTSRRQCASCRRRISASLSLPLSPDGLYKFGVAKLSEKYTSGGYQIYVSGGRNREFDGSFTELMGEVMDATGVDIPGLKIDEALDIVERGKGGGAAGFIVDPEEGTVDVYDHLDYI